MLGILSLMFWSLILVVSVKYAGFIMRADNKGEGGIMALTALAQRSVRSSQRARWWIVVLGLFGASLFFGDGVITPAISVLGAVEGLEVLAPAAGALDRAAGRCHRAAAVRVPEPRHRSRRGRVRAGDAALVRRARGARSAGTSCQHPGVLRAHVAVLRRSNSSRTRTGWRSSRSARSCCASPAPKRSMPTWAISARSRSAGRGSGSCCRRWC